jgi:hypothetical protein
METYHHLKHAFQRKSSLDRKAPIPGERHKAGIGLFLTLVWAIIYSFLTAVSLHLCCLVRRFSSVWQMLTRGQVGLLSVEAVVSQIVTTLAIPSL